jgi:hypothetical protein
LGPKQKTDPKLHPKPPQPPKAKAAPMKVPPAGAKLIPDEGGYWLYRNASGRFELSGLTGACRYRWRDGKVYTRGLEFVAHTALSDTVDRGTYFGWVYRLHDDKQPRKSWIFFSYTPLRGISDGSNRVYPLYISLEGPDRGFQRWLTRNGTIGIEKVLGPDVPPAIEELKPKPKEDKEDKAKKDED